MAVAGGYAAYWAAGVVTSISAGIYYCRNSNTEEDVRERDSMIPGESQDGPAEEADNESPAGHNYSDA